jgi:hypothetical protein
LFGKSFCGNAFEFIAHCDQLRHSTPVSFVAGVWKLFTPPLVNLDCLCAFLVSCRLAHLNRHTFGYFILIAMFANFTCILLGLAISAFAPNMEAAAAMGPPFVIIGIMFGGFYIRIDSLPIILNWVPFISLFQWTFRGLATNEFQGMTFTCDSTDVSKCMTTGEQVLTTLAFNGHSTSYAMFGLAMLMLCYLAALYFILLFSSGSYTPLGFIGSQFSRYLTTMKDKPDTNKSAVVVSAAECGVELVAIPEENSSAPASS